MSGDENIERRVTAVEEEMVVVRQEVAAARALGAGADRDVADFRAEMRAHTRGLNALRQTQIEHYAEHKADLVEIRGDLAGIKAEHKADLIEINAGLKHIVRLLEGSAGGSGGR